MNTYNPEDYLIFDCVTGSRLYGTSNELSDYDYRGVCNMPLEVLLNPFVPFEQKDSGFEEEDRVIYSLGKFFKLCADANPNILELLFIPPQNARLIKSDWLLIMERRHLFLSKKAKYTFTGYAFSQLKSVESHRRWFLNPPKEKPARKQFGLTDTPIITGDNLDSALNIPGELFKPQYHDELVREREYRAEKKKWDNYVSWRDNRNPARKETEERCGYDTKAVGHIFRLIEEGRELLTTGHITFPLPNADEILDIKNGKYEYDEMMDKAHSLERDFERWYAESVLPQAPDRNGLYNLYMDIVRP